MDDLDWKLIKHLHATGNVSRTANDLYISQPSLTKKIKKIEQEFNIKLYNRKSRGVAFTEQGAYLAEQASQIAEDLDQIKENALKMNDQVMGKLNIGASNHYAKYHLSRILKGFQSIYPKVEFNIISGISKEIFHLMNTENIHVGLIRGDYSWSGCKRLLYEDPMCLVADKEIDFSALPRLPRIDYRTGTVINSLIESWWESWYDQPPVVGMFVDSMEGCKEMVRHGLGYGILPASILNDDDTLFKVNLVNQDTTPLVSKTWMYYAEPLEEIKIVSEFVNYVQEFTHEGGKHVGQND